MIVSHLHKFIFLKTRKTAGTSVEIALSKACGRDDIITRFGRTPIDDQDELTRGAAGGRPSQNDTLPLRSFTMRDVGRFLLKGRPAPIAIAHLSATRARRLVGATIWDEYYKFAIERNPWDAMVSMYYFVTRDGMRDWTFEEFLESDQARRLASNWANYAIGDRLAVDAVCRYENLEEDLARVTEVLGLDDLDLPRAKGGLRMARDYRAMYNDVTREKVAELSSRTISAFGYTFE